jgi:Annexin
MSQQDNEATAKASGLFTKVFDVIKIIATITTLGRGLTWVYENAVPIIQPLLDADLFSPERFWYHGVQHTKGQPPEAVAAALDEAIKDVLSRRDDIIRLLSTYSDEERQRISDAYDAILSNLRKDYPNALP